MTWSSNGVFAYDAKNASSQRKYKKNEVASNKTPSARQSQSEEITYEIRQNICKLYVYKKQESKIYRNKTEKVFFSARET